MPRTLDVMGYKLAPVFSLFSKDEIKAAKRLSKARGYQWDTVGTDPRVTGWRFLRDAKIVLSGKDLGQSCPIDGDGSPR
jgi:hypothetical protein